MQQNYNKTIAACFVSYIIQAVVNTFAPLLFVTFQQSYGIPLSFITALITLNFLIQLCLDFASAFFIDKIGYRASLLIAHALAALGLILLTVLPEMPGMPPFAGILISVFFYAIGGGLIEVVVSPVVEACPNDHKDRTMSLLHSFYCWGQVGVVALSTLFFAVCGIENWRILSLCWAVIPFLNGFYFLLVPINKLTEDGESLPIRKLLSMRLFWLFVLLMLCAGASELAMSQWSSAFAEKGLGISKVMGDLAGPTIFALLMGLSRAVYGRLLNRFSLRTMMLFSGALCAAAYLIVGLVPNPAAGLVGMALCGFSVGIMWPGTFSTAAVEIKNGGTAMFALLALAGDLGCASGPTLAGLVAGALGDNLRLGILSSGVFPFVLVIALLMLGKKKA